MKLVFVRHAESEGNADGRLQGQTEFQLNFRTLKNYLKSFGVTSTKREYERSANPTECFSRGEGWNL